MSSISSIKLICCLVAICSITSNVLVADAKNAKKSPPPKRRSKPPPPPPPALFLTCGNGTTTPDQLCRVCKASPAADHEACMFCMVAYPGDRFAIQKTACLECVMKTIGSGNKYGVPCAKCASKMDKPVDPCDKNSSTANACFNCLYSGFKSPSECHINATAPNTYPIKITFTASNSSVWPSKGALAVEAALVPFFQEFGVSIQKGAIYSYATGGKLQTTLLVSSDKQAINLMKKAKDSSKLKPSADVLVRAAGDDLPCGTTISISYGNQSSLMKCGALQTVKGQDDVEVNVPGLCCNNNTSIKEGTGRALLQGGQSACGPSNWPVGGQCSYTSGSIVWCTATGQAYMIMGGSAVAYATYPLADDPNNPALAAASTTVNAYTLVGSPTPTFTTSVCCSSNVNGCDVVSSTPTSPQPVPSTNLGWDQYASFYNSFVPSPSSVNSPAYLMSPNGAYALYVSTSGQLELYAVTSNGALSSEPYWSGVPTGIWGQNSQQGAYFDNLGTYMYETTYDMTCVQGTATTTITESYLWSTYNTYSKQTQVEYTCQEWGNAASYSLAMQSDCNLVLYMNSATVNGQVVTQRSLTQVTNVATVTSCGSKSECKQHPAGTKWSYGTPTTTYNSFPFPVWATNTSTSNGLCNLYLSNSGQLTVNNTYAQTLWSSPAATTAPPTYSGPSPSKCLLTAGQVVGGTDSMFAAVLNPTTLAVEAIPFTPSGYALAGTPYSSISIPDTFITSTTVAGCPISTKPQIDGLNPGQTLGPIQILGYGSLSGNLGFCLQTTGSSAISMNPSSTGGYLQCTPTVGSSGNFFTAYPIASNSGGDMVFSLQPTQNPLFGCVGVVSGTLQLLNTCNALTNANQQFYMTAVSSTAPDDYSSQSSAVTSWSTISSPSTPGLCLSSTALSFITCNLADTTQWFLTESASLISSQFNATAGVLTTLSFTDPSILLKLESAWSIVTMNSTLNQAVGTATFPTSMNNAAGIASVTFSSGVIQQPLTSLIPIEYMKFVWLGAVQAQIMASPSGTQTIATSSYFYAYPTFAYASSGNAFLDVTVTFTANPPPPATTPCPASSTKWGRVIRGGLMIGVNVLNVFSGRVVAGGVGIWCGLATVLSGTQTSTC